MTEALAVLLGDRAAGTVTRRSGGRLRFDYDDRYRSSPDATPLSVSMPLQVPSHPDRVVTPWLWGLLPDNDAVVGRWARHFHVSASSPFSLLSTPVGEDCAGAVRLVGPDQLDRFSGRQGGRQRGQQGGRQGGVTWLTEDDVAQRLRELREDSTAWLGRSFTGQFSLAGAQAKTALLYDGKRWGVPTGVTPTTHILKPAVSGLDDHDLNEHLCLDAARRCGLAAVRTRVRRFAGESAVVVERYDRIRRGTALVRVHQEDVCQALGLPPSHKYQNDGGPGVPQIVALFRGVMPPRIADMTVWQFADALIWNWLVAGTDAHAKNYSLLLAGSQVRLAPLYDVASALPYGTDERKLRLAMKIGGDYRVYPWRNTWPAAARDLGVDADRLVDRVVELARAAPDAFLAAASAGDVQALARPLPATLTDLVADRARRCLRSVEAAGPIAHRTGG